MAMATPPKKDDKSEEYRSDKDPSDPDAGAYKGLRHWSEIPDHGPDHAGIFGDWTPGDF